MLAGNFNAFMKDLFCTRMLFYLIFAYSRAITFLDDKPATFLPPIPILNRELELNSDDSGILEFLASFVSLSWNPSFEC